MNMKNMCELVGMLALVVSLSLGAGCGEKKAAANNPPAPQKTAAKETAPAPLEQCLVRWQQGDKEGAIRLFIETDWKKGPTISSGSPLNHRESELRRLPQAELARLNGEVLAQLGDLKQLANAVRAKGKAAAGTDKELAGRCFASLNDCGAALDQPDGMMIVNLVGRVIRKMAAAEPAK